MLLSAIAGGFIGTLVFSTVVKAASEMALTRMDLALLLGTAVTDNRRKARAIGFIFHLLLGVVFAIGWTPCVGPTLAAIQHCAPPSMRATASAVFLFVNNFIGLGAGTWLIGWLSDAFTAQYGANSLRYAILAVVSFYLVSAALFLLSARRLERDWE